MVGDPADYRWSSDRANADGQHNPLLQPYPIDLALGANDAERPAAYRALFAIAIDTESPGPCARAYRRAPRSGTTGSASASRFGSLPSWRKR